MGMKHCPKCGNGSFRIHALQSVEVCIKLDDDDPEEFEVEDTEQNGDTEWTDSDSASCRDCEWSGTVGDISDEEETAGPGKCVRCGTQCEVRGDLSVLCPLCTLLENIAGLGRQDIYTDAQEYAGRVGRIQSLMGVLGEFLGGKMPTVDIVQEALTEGTCHVCGEDLDGDKILSEDSEGRSIHMECEPQGLVTEGEIAFPELSEDDWEEIDSLVPEEMYDKIAAQGEEPVLTVEEWQQIRVYVLNKLTEVRSGAYGDDRLGKDWAEHLKEMSHKFTQFLMPNVTA